MGLNGIASTAGLEPSSAMVWVGPPLFWRPLGSSPAGVLLRSPGPVRPQDPSSERLCPSEAIVPAQLADGKPWAWKLCASRVFFNVVDPESFQMAPPELPEFPKKVAFVRVSAAKLNIPPPPKPL